MTRKPMGAHEVVQHDELLAEIEKQNGKRRRAKAAKQQTPEWFRNPTLNHTDTVNAVDYPLLLATPLETIAALLLHDDAEVESTYGDTTSARLKTLQSGPVFRVAVMALRLEHADAAAVAEHRRLSATIEQLKEQRDAIGEKIPREVRRGW